MRNDHVAVICLSEQNKYRLGEQLNASPVYGNYCFLEPDVLNKIEEPLLLHPYIDNPQEHIVFGEFGTITCVEGSDKGKHSIMVYDLDDADLTDARHKAQIRAFGDYLRAIVNAEGSIQDRLEEADQCVSNYRDGNEPYSAAVLDYLKAFKTKFSINSREILMELLNSNRELLKEILQELLNLNPDLREALRDQLNS